MSHTIIMKNKITGIYLIKNKINGHCYVGQSVDIKARWYRHKNNSHNQYLMRALQKYGEINFGFYVIKVCGRKNLSKWERYYLEKITCDCSKCFNMKSHYNLEMSVNDSYTINEETRKKMSKIKKSENHPFYGKTGEKSSNWKGGWTLDPEKRKVYMKEYNLKNVEKIREYRLKNAEKRKAYDKARYLKKKMERLNNE